MSKTIGQKQSQAHEKRLAKAIGGKVTPASGAFWSAKGDVKSDDLLVEHKYTGKKSFTLQAAVLKKIEHEAILEGRMPVLGVSLDNCNWVILTEDDFLQLREAWISQTTPSP